MLKFNTLEVGNVVRLTKFAPPWMDPTGKHIYDYSGKILALPLDLVVNNLLPDAVMFSTVCGTRIHIPWYALGYTTLEYINA